MAAANYWWLEKAEHDSNSKVSSFFFFDTSSWARVVCRSDDITSWLYLLSLFSIILVITQQLSLVWVYNLVVFIHSCLPPTIWTVVGPPVLVSSVKQPKSSADIFGFTQGVTLKWLKSVWVIHIGNAGFPFPIHFQCNQKSETCQQPCFCWWCPLTSICSADPESTAVARLSRAEAYAALRQYHKALEDAEFCSRPETLQRSSAEVGHRLYSSTPNSHRTSWSNTEEWRPCCQLLPYKA